MTSAVKPLGRKAYGSIGHLAGSRLGTGDHKLHDGQTALLTSKVRDRHDVVIVQEKLDGSNVAVARVGGQILALGRAGYLAQTSKYRQHQLFAVWVREREELFGFLQEGESLSGEWLAQAHGTRYQLTHEPFVAFDLFTGGKRNSYAVLRKRLVAAGLIMPTVLSVGPPLSVEEAMEALGEHGFHGAIDPVEGAVWRMERKGMVDFLGKYVRPDKVDGCYLSEVSGKDAVWNWWPT